METRWQPVDTAYSGDCLNHVAFPMGGIGAGMICLEGTGALSHVSVRHQPKVFLEPVLFSALHIKGTQTPRVLEGPVPRRKIFGAPGTGNGGRGSTYGFPRFGQATFSSRFPFGTVCLTDPDMPVTVDITGWSPFVPGDANDSSLPACALEFRVVNDTAQPLSATYSFHASNFLATEASGGAVAPSEHGFSIGCPGSTETPADEAVLIACIPDRETTSDCAWFRGGWFDPLTMVWRNVTLGKCLSAEPHASGTPGSGASLYLPLDIPPNGSTSFRLLLTWYVPHSDLRVGGSAPQDSCCCDTADTYQPWYSSAFADADTLSRTWASRYDELRQKSACFTDAFYDTDLPGELVEASAANLSILKSPTCLRQHDGRFWGWEGCCDSNGCCAGTCTHVWNYAQALPHLFPDLERSMRLTEFHENQNEEGHQTFRALLPIRPTDHSFHAAADGQLGGIMKVFREWQISGDTEWLRELWPKVVASLRYCIKTWDPRGRGVLEEPHHNTYDIEFWGADGMCSSFYLGALSAACQMGEALDEECDEFRQLLNAGRRRMEDELFDGEYFVQKIEWQNLSATDPTDAKGTLRTSYSDEAVAILEKEGPKYQYGSGCLSDGVLGAWLAEMCGVGEVLDPDMVRSHLCAVYAHNLKHDLTNHANPQRPTYAVGNEGGLLLCTWPKGGELSLPFVYSNEVWTGIEYQVASHLILTGNVEKGLDIVKTCRKRYDGRTRNPFNEYECGHWYARAMSSYGLLIAWTGVRYSAVTRTLHLRPAVPGDFRAFFAVGSAFGTVGVRAGVPFCDIRAGNLTVDQIDYVPASQ